MRTRITPNTDTFYAVVIKFNQNAYLELYIDMNNDLRKETKNDFEKYIFK